MKALIVYWTKTGHTRRAAQDVAAGLAQTGSEVTLVDLRQNPAPDVGSYDIVVVGSPCHAGSIKFAGSGIARPVETFLRRLPPESLLGKRAGAYSLQSGLGAARTVGSVERLLADAGAEVVSPGPVVTAGVAFSLWEGPRASEADRERLREFGRMLGAPNR